MIAAAVAAFHVAAFLGLLAAHIVESVRQTPPIETTLTFVVVPPLPVGPLPRARPGLPGKAGGPYVDVESFALPGPNAITVPNIAIFVAKHVHGKARNCPLVLRPDSLEWKRLCAPEKNFAEGEEGEEGGEDLAAVRRNAAIFARVEAELSKHYKPAEVPCTYMRKEKLPGGPNESSAAIVNIGCAAKQLFGGN